MKKTMIALAVLLAINTTPFAQTAKPGQTKTTTKKQVVKYTCPMHPEVIKDKPGKCPKCAMTLVKMKPGKMKGLKM
jgi:uncharacterized paraquat-inducible protein A